MKPASKLGSTPFGPTDYGIQVFGSTASARAVVPRVMKMLSPRSVLDLGCGTGAWLSVFDQSGVGDLQGVDATRASDETLQISRSRIKECRLEDPLDLGRRFDLAMSVEVAEHLPESAAETIVASLCKHSDAVLFSAAVPGQGGFHHINEQWPDYWARIFRANGYDCFDILRSEIWDNENVEWWYRQNIFIYAQGESAARLGTLTASSGMPMRVVHPEFLRATMQPRTVRQLVRDRLKSGS